MKKFIRILAAGSLFPLLTINSSAQTTYIWDGGGTTDAFDNPGNWDPDGVPGSGDTGTVESSLVVIPTLVAMETGATINFNGSSTLQRNSSFGAKFDGTLNINDQTNVEVSQWQPANNSTLNWNSTGILTIAPSGATGSIAHFWVDDDDNNSGTVINMHDGTWNLDSGTTITSFNMEDGTFNLMGGVIVSDALFRLGRGDTNAGGTFNYGPAAELRTRTMGLFGTSVFNFEAGSTLYIYAGFLGGFGGKDGADYFRDELRLGAAGSNVYIDGVQQFIGPEDELTASNFTATQVQIDGTWYDAITATAVADPVVVISGIVLSGSNLEITCPSQAGIDYLLETSPDLSPGSWSSAETKTGTGADLLFSVPAPLTPGTQAYYRVTAPAP